MKQGREDSGCSPNKTLLPIAWLLTGGEDHVSGKVDAFSRFAHIRSVLRWTG